MRLHDPQTRRRLAIALLLFAGLNLACRSLFTASSAQPTPAPAVIVESPTVVATNTVAGAIVLVATATPNGAASDSTAEQKVADRAPFGAEIATRSIYAGALDPAWVNWSWDAQIGFASGSAVTAADTAQAIAVTYQAAWGAFYLHLEDAVAATAFDRLRFRVHGGTEGGQRFVVALADAGGVFQPTGVAVSAAANAWQTVELSLATVSGLTQISGIAWQDASGGQQPTFYIDNIELVDISLPPTPTPEPLAGPALRVDASTTLHVISPAIYGINFADEALAKDLALPVRRWGGNGTTRYNWQIDTASHTSDWFFENIPKENTNVALLPVGSAADQFVEQDRRTGTKSLLTMPLIGWTPKSREITCGFSVAKYGPQQAVDPWRTDCGNGIDAQGEFIRGNDPTDTSMPIDEQFVAGWLQHLIGRFGRAAEGGVAYYSLDNEPMLWHETHRDVHPDPLSYDELRDLTYRYAATIKQVDPTAQTIGPAFWGWTAYFYSALDRTAGDSWWNRAPDRNAHGGLPLTPWYLAQMQAYEATHGVRLLDYLDLHYYPQATGVALGTAGNGETQALRLRTTRSLWDPTYVDESWIGEPVQLIRRMRAWVDEYYPGTKLAISEYNWGGLEQMNGALAQAEVLGIFGREGLDMAMLWDPLAADMPFAYAFRLYRNYDGQGSQFGDQSLAAESTDAEQLAIYAARRSSDQALTLLVINKNKSPLRTTLTINGAGAAKSAIVYQYSNENLQAIVRQPDQPIAAGGTLETIVAGNALTLFIIAD